MEPYGHVEYDDYVQRYRAEQNQQLRFSGETGEYFAAYKVEKLREWLPEFTSRSNAVLDYGCGDGLMASYAKRIFPRSSVFGIDSSSRSIEQARRHHPGITFSCVQGGALPFPDGSMDLVYASGVLHHIPFSEHPTAIGEIFRVLAPGGWFALMELNPFNPFSVFVFRSSPFDRHARVMFPGYSRRLLEPYGAVETKYYAFFPAWLRWFRPFESSLEKLPLGALYASLVKKEPGESDRRPMRL